jgi:DNA-binding transcriptional LysR family regulator
MDQTQPLSQYLAVLMLFALAVAATGGMIVVSGLLGKRGARNAAKDRPWECGMIPVGEGGTRLSVKFYLVAMLPNTILYAAQLPLIKELVNSGRAGTFLSKELAETFPEMVSIKLREKIPINFSLVWNKDRSVSRSARVLIDYIVARSPINA